MDSVSSSFTSATVSRNKSLLNAADSAYLRQERKLDIGWIYANCDSADIPRASLILGYEAKSPCIVFWSDDFKQQQLRPHTPWESTDGKCPKYRTPKGEYDAFLAKHPEIEKYWTDLEGLKARCFTINGKPYLLVTEGCIKGITGCQHGIPTVALVGVTMGLTPKRLGTPNLVPVLKHLAKAGFGFIFAFDSDTKPETVKNVRYHEAKLTKALKSYGCPVLSVTGDWEPGEKGETKGMDDFINKNGIEAFRAILMKAESCGVESRDTADNKAPNKSRNKQLLDLIETHWGGRLRFNEMTQQVELNGKADLDIELVYLRLAEELGVDIPKQTASDLVMVVARKYAYSPVRDYLNSLTGIESIDLNSLSERYFGTNDPLHAVLLKRTLIAAVARAFKPGCKVDTLCILQGGQGELKSTFWQTLASEAWFTDNLTEGNEKDEKLKLRRYWILEFSEFETAYKKKEVEQLKAFLSSRIDSLRRPYGRSIEDFPRTSIFAGSTNRQEFLHDPTGERRYWVIPVSKKIPIQTVEAERDRIWAAAVAAYKAGEQWWLTPEEDELLAEANEGWQSSDTWEADILHYLEFRSSCTVNELLEKCIGLDLGQQGKGEQMRVSDILRRNGWTKVVRRVDGKVQRRWEKVVTGVVTGVVTPQKPLPETASDTVLPPVTTFSPKHPPNANSVAEAGETEDSQSEKSLENKGGNTPSNKSQNLSLQDLPPVTTSPNQGGNTSPSPETHANKRRAQRLADEVREARETGNQEEEKRIMKQVAESSLQLRGFFKKSLDEKKETLAVGDRVEITLKSDYQGQKGVITDIGYGATEIDYYIKLENEKVIVTVPTGVDSFAYLRKL